MSPLLIQAEIIRFVLSFILIILTNIPLPFKIIGGWLLDRIDCMSDWWPYKGPLGSDNTRICHTHEYSVYDKIGDILLNTLLLYATHQLYPSYTPILFSLYVYRIAGVLRFFKTRDKKEFIYFPNLFITTVLVLSITGKLTIPIFSGIAVYQISQELYMHLPPRECDE
jgi:hypothetical protein